MSDPNPIIDEGNPTSTAGILSVVKLCDILGREMSLEMPRARYLRGWGPNSSDAVERVAAWTLYLKDMHGESVALTFYVTIDGSPIVIGMYIKRFTVTDNLVSPPQIKMERPSDKGTRRMETYMRTDEPLQIKLRLLVVPDRCTKELIGKTRKPLNIRPLTLSKRIHSMKHAHPSQMMRICEEAGWMCKELEDAIKTVSINCPSCALSGLTVS